MNFTDLIWEVPNAIPDTLCDDLVNFFDEKEDLQYQGRTAGGVTLDIKVSTDLGLNPENAPELDERLYEHVTKHNKEYIDLYAKLIFPEEIRQSQLYCLDMHDTGYQIQKTVKGGFYTWHNDYDACPVLDTLPTLGSGTQVMLSDRVCTFIYYLSDDFEGGRTQFYFNGEVHSVVPEKGKAVWFPANTLYVHRGEPVESGEKYLVTGWIYCETLRHTVITCSESKEIRSKIGEENMVFAIDDDGYLVDR